MYRALINKMVRGGTLVQKIVETWDLEGWPQKYVRGELLKMEGGWVGGLSPNSLEIEG